MAEETPEQLKARIAELELQLTKGAKPKSTKKKTIDELALEAFEAHPHVEVVYVDLKNQCWHLVNIEKSLKDKSKATLKAIERP